MNVQQFRPKYSIEQYLVSFKFPATPTEDPSVEVSLETGEDPNAEDFAGVFAVVASTVYVLVAGGVPGCVYRITCTCAINDEVFTTAGVIAVKPTAADPPENSPDIPPYTERAASPVYPGIYYDSYTMAFAPVGGSIVDMFVYSQLPPDEVSFSFAPVGGLIFVPPPGVVEPDEVEFSFVPVSGKVTDSRLGEWPDEVNMVFQPVDGTIKLAPVGEIDPDSITFTFIPVSGTIS